MQKIKGNNEKIVPEHLDLDNEVHRIIFDKDLPYEPVKLVTSLPVVKVKPTAVKTIPPNVLKEERLLGFTEQNVNDSFFWSTISIIALYNGDSQHLGEKIKAAKIFTTWSAGLRTGDISV